MAEFRTGTNMEALTSMAKRARDRAAHGMQMLAGGRRDRGQHRRAGGCRLDRRGLLPATVGRHGLAGSSTV